MAKLEKRQIIILGLTAIVILYAAVDFLMPKKRDTSVDLQQQTEDLNSFITTLTTGMGKDFVLSSSAGRKGNGRGTPFWMRHLTNHGSRSKSRSKRRQRRRRSNLPIPVILKWTKNG
jgi:hypothetical protein